MTLRNLRAPTVASGPAEVERFYRLITEKLDNTTVSLDDALRALLLTTGTTQGQENENALGFLERVVAENKSLRGKVSELERRINDLERLTWL